MIRYILLAAIAWLVVRWFQRYLASGPTPAPRRRVAASPPRPWSGEPDRPAHEVLGVRPDATPEEIRAAYQHLVRENHPDRVAHMAREFQELADRRTKEINRAYEQLKRA
jgi:DnaJ-domain-containing protein 1